MSDFETQIITSDDVAALDADALGLPGGVDAPKLADESATNAADPTEAELAAAILAVEPDDGLEEYADPLPGPSPQTGQVAYDGPIVQPSRAYLGLSDEAEWDEARFGPEENPPVTDEEDDE